MSARSVRTYNYKLKNYDTPLRSVRMVLQKLTTKQIRPLPLDISPRLFDALFADGVHLVTGTRCNMKNRLMTLWDKIMLRKRYVIECINHLLKDKGNLVHSRHGAVNNFIMNLIAALEAYCFFDNKPEAIKGYRIEDNKQLSLF